MDKDYTQLAQIGYAAYCAASDGKAFDGSPLKTWDELDEPRQTYWKANASAIEQAVLTAVMNTQSQTTDSGKPEFDQAQVDAAPVAEAATETSGEASAAA